MMTEDDAKQRWCPLVRFKSGNTGSETTFNRSGGWPTGNVHPDTACIGSKCMAWRGKMEPRNVAPDPSDILTIVDVGYCGAFGGQSNG